MKTKNKKAISTIIAVTVAVSLLLFRRLRARQQRGMLMMIVKQRQMAPQEILTALSRQRSPLQVLETQSLSLLELMKNNLLSIGL
jgi:hypothetical protein